MQHLGKIPRVKIKIDQKSHSQVAQVYTPHRDTPPYHVFTGIFASAGPSECHESKENIKKRPNKFKKLKIIQKYDLKPIKLDNIKSSAKNMKIQLILAYIMVFQGILG